MTNAIHYIDFEPQVTEKKFWKGNIYEPTSAVMERVNTWVRKNYNHNIVNVETIMMPKPAYGAGYSGAHKLNMHGGHIYLVEVVRVWYKD